LEKKIEEEINSQIKGLVERQLTKKRLNVSGIIIFNFFVVKNSFKKDDVQHIGFCKTLVF
jgi:hypothetical protein